MFREAMTIVLSLTAIISAEDHGVYFTIKENYIICGGNNIMEEKADSLMTCAQTCARHQNCRGANYIQSRAACSLHGESQTLHTEQLLKRKGSIYLEKVGSLKTSETPGSTQSSAVTSCQTLSSQSPSSSSGVYWIDPDGGSHADAFKSYCDMDTDGGGWTLVWSYTFTNYSHFTSKLNAITPRPNWPADSKVDVPFSTTPPMNEGDYNAINFSYWKQLGRQVLIKSNTNNWLVCDDVTGSLVDWKNGSVDCQIVKWVTDTCKDKPAPSSITVGGYYGPIFLTTTSIYYYFDGSTENNWPTHDPCGRNQGNHVKNVVNPHGNIFIRLRNSDRGTKYP